MCAIFSCYFVFLMQEIKLQFLLLFDQLEMYCDALLPYPYPPSVWSEADEDNTTKQLRKQTHSSTVQKRENGTKRVRQCVKMRQNEAFCQKVWLSWDSRCVILFSIQQCFKSHKNVSYNTVAHCLKITWNVTFEFF